jgi:predicted transcriptional regulator
MYSQKPGIAKKWRKKYGPQTNLPERAAKKKGVLAAYKEGGKKMGRS